VLVRESARTYLGPDDRMTNTAAFVGGPVYGRCFWSVANVKLTKYYHRRNPVVIYIRIVGGQLVVGGGGVHVRVANSLFIAYSETLIDHESVYVQPTFA